MWKFFLFSYLVVNVGLWFGCSSVNMYYGCHSPANNLQIGYFPPRF
jgi:hypothetical protein